MRSPSNAGALLGVKADNSRIGMARLKLRNASGNQAHVKKRCARRSPRRKAAVYGAHAHPQRHIRADQKEGVSVGKGSRIMAIADCDGLTVAVYASGASAHESQLVEPTLATCFMADDPQRLIGDKAYDLDAVLVARGIELR